MVRRLLESTPAVLVTAFVARFATIAFIDFSAFNWQLPRPDLLMEYGVIARNLLNGLGYSYTWYSADGLAVTLPSAYMPPGQVFIDYTFITLFGYTTAAVIALFILQVLMGVACVWLVGKIAHQLFLSAPITGTARWIMALYPPFIVTAMSFGVTSSVMFVSCALILASLHVVRSLNEGTSSMQHILLLGVSCGALALLRGEGLVFVAVTLIVIGIKLQHSRRRVVMPLMAVSALTLLMVLPWTIRNYVIFDRFIPVSSNGSFNFWRGNNAISSGSPLTESGDPLWSSSELWMKAEKHLSEGATFENRYSDIYRNAAFDWIAANPFDTAALSLKKALLFWTFDIRNKAAGWIYAALHLIALGLTVMGSVRLMRMRKRLNALSRTGLQLIFLWAVVTTIIAMVFLPLTRFQVMTMALLVPVAAFGITSLWMRKALEPV
jgi:hypothetical protein